MSENVKELILSAATLALAIVWGWIMIAVMTPVPPVPPVP